MWCSACIPAGPSSRWSRGSSHRAGDEPPGAAPDRIAPAPRRRTQLACRFPFAADLMDRRTWTRSDGVAPLPSLLARQPQDPARYVSGMPAPVRRYACGMGKTSVYLSDELSIRWHASSLSLSEVVRRGLDAIEGAPDLVTEVRRAIREELAGVSLAADRSQAR